MRRSRRTGDRAGYAARWPWPHGCGPRYPDVGITRIIPIPGLSRCLRVVAGSGLFWGNGCRDNPGWSEGFEERDELIRWLVSSECCRGRGGSVQGFLFEFEIGMEVNAGGVDFFVAEP